MKAALLVVLLCAAPARALWFPGRASTLNAPRQAFEAARYEQVVADLQDRVGRMRSAEQPEGYLLLGQAQERLGRLDQALGVMQLAVRLYPKDINLLTELAVLLHRSGLEEQAGPLFQKVLRIHPNNAVAHLGLAEIDHALGFLDRSAEHYERSLETMSDDATVWRDYSEVLIAARDFKTAELAARKSLSLREDAEGMVDLARAQRADGRLNDALAQLDAAVARFPQRADLAMTRALWLLEAGREDDADAAVAPLLTAPQPAPLAYWIRARVRLKRDQYRAAVDDLRKAAAAERGSPFVAAAAKELLKQLAAE